MRFILLCVQQVSGGQMETMNVCNCNGTKGHWFPHTNQFDISQLEVTWSTIYYCKIQVYSDVTLCFTMLQSAHLTTRVTSCKSVIFSNTAVENLISRTCYLPVYDISTLRSLHKNQITLQRRKRMLDMKYQKHADNAMLKKAQASSKALGNTSKIEEL